MGVGSLWRERVADADADAGPTRWTCVGWIIESRRRVAGGAGHAAGSRQGRGRKERAHGIGHWKGEVES